MSEAWYSSVKPGNTQHNNQALRVYNYIRILYDPHVVQVTLLWALVTDVLVQSGTKGEGAKEREEDK